MPIQICDYTLCTACSACVNICPQQCVEMQAGELGHLYPYINRDKCVECNACMKVCPNNSPIVLKQPITAFAGWHTADVEYQSSTSGGAATAFAQTIISEGGVVYGCACLDKIDIRHIRVDNFQDLNKLKGSKYVQSTMSENFKSVKSDLKAGLKVLFIGTPCQIAGLKSFLHGQPDNLYLVDLICHGVPSVKLLQEHVKNVLGHQKVTNISFRSDSYLLLLLLCGDKILYKSNLMQRYEDEYYNAFIDGYSYRESCYRCSYAQSKRVSDVTIGDFWGLGDDFGIEHPHGCSCILPITEKGLNLIKRSDMILYERTVGEAVQGNDQLRAPKAKDKKINRFRKLYPILGLKYAYRITVARELLFKLRCRLMLGTRLRKIIKFGKRE